MNSSLNLVILTLALSGVVSAGLLGPCYDQASSKVEPMENCVKNKWWINSWGVPSAPLGAPELPKTEIPRMLCCFKLERMCSRNREFTPDCRTQKIPEYIELIKDCKNDGIDVKSGTAAEKCAQAVPKTQGRSVGSCDGYKSCTDYTYHMTGSYEPKDDSKDDSNSGRMPVTGWGHILFLISILLSIAFILN